MQLNSQKGFTLTEMAVVFTIVALLLATTMATLSSQRVSGDIDKTGGLLNGAVGGVIGFALVKKRPPSPPTATSSGIEAPATGGTCTSSFGGYVPAQTLGIQPTNS